MCHRMHCPAWQESHRKEEERELYINSSHGNQNQQSSIREEEEDTTAEITADLQSEEVIEWEVTDDGEIAVQGDSKEGVEAEVEEKAVEGPVKVEEAAGVEVTWKEEEVEETAVAVEDVVQ